MSEARATRSWHGSQQQPVRPPRGNPRLTATGSAGALGRDERIELFCQRVGEYRADVRRVAEAELAAVITTVCARA